MVVRVVDVNVHKHVIRRANGRVNKLHMFLDWFRIPEVIPGMATGTCTVDTTQKYQPALIVDENQGMWRQVAGLTSEHCPSVVGRHVFDIKFRFT